MYDPKKGCTRGPTGSRDTELIAQHQAKVNAWITTVTGKRICLPHIRPEQVSVIDIAHSLGLQCRYMGHCQQFYSVAEHSNLVANLAALSGEDELTVRCAQLHDAHEAYLSDFPSPFKEAVSGLREFEDQIERSVREAFALPSKDDPVWKRVKHYDIIALHLEASTLLRGPGWIDTGILALVPRVSEGVMHPLVRISCWDPIVATEMFKRSLHDLGIGLGGA